MLYKIARITDHDDMIKEEPEAVSRMNRIIDLNLAEISIGKSLFMECVRPGFLKSIITSPVQAVYSVDNGAIIDTMNSYYYLEEFEL